MFTDSPPVQFAACGRAAAGALAILLDLTAGHLTFDQAGVKPVAFEQFIMRAQLHDGSLIHGQNDVGIADRAEPMGNNNLGAGELDFVHFQLNSTRHTPSDQAGSEAIKQSPGQ